MHGSTVIGIRWETIGSGIEAIGLERRMLALVGGLLVMSTGNTSKVTGKEIAAGWSITTTGTMIETGIIVRKSGVVAKGGMATRIDSSSASNNRLTYLSSFTL